MTSASESGEQRDHGDNEEVKAAHLDRDSVAEQGPHEVALERLVDRQ